MICPAEEERTASSLKEFEANSDPVSSDSAVEQCHSLSEDEELNEDQSDDLYFENSSDSGHQNEDSPFGRHLSYQHYTRSCTNEDQLKGCAKSTLKSKIEDKRQKYDSEDCSDRASHTVQIDSDLDKTDSSHNSSKDRSNSAFDTESHSDTSREEEEEGNFNKSVEDKNDSQEDTQGDEKCCPITENEDVNADRSDEHEQIDKCSEVNVCKKCNETPEGCTGFCKRPSGSKGTASSNNENYAEKSIAEYSSETSEPMPSTSDCDEDSIVFCDLITGEEKEEEEQEEGKEGIGNEGESKNEDYSAKVIEKTYVCTFCKNSFSKKGFSFHYDKCEFAPKSVDTIREFNMKNRPESEQKDIEHTNDSSKLKEMLEGSNLEEKKTTFLAGLNLRSKQGDKGSERRNAIKNRGNASSNGKADLADIESILSVTNRSSILLHRSESSEKNSAPMVVTSALNLFPSNSKQSTEDDDDPFKSEVRDMKKRGEFPCRICQKVFRNLRALKGHARIHIASNRVNTPYECNICSFSTLDKAAVIRHVRSHNGDHPYKCQICFSTFTTKANCERHLRNAHRKTSREDVKKLLIDLNAKHQTGSGTTAHVGSSTLQELLSGNRTKKQRVIAAENISSKPRHEEQASPLLSTVANSAVPQPALLMYVEQDIKRQPMSVEDSSGVNLGFSNLSIPVIDKEAFSVNDDNNNSNNGSIVFKRRGSNSEAPSTHGRKDSNISVVSSDEIGSEYHHSDESLISDVKYEHTDNGKQPETDTVGTNENTHGIRIASYNEKYSSTRFIFPSTCYPFDSVPAAYTFSTPHSLQTRYNVVRGVPYSFNSNKRFIEDDGIIRVRSHAYFPYDKDEDESDQPLDLTMNVLDLSTRKRSTEERTNGAESMETDVESTEVENSATRIRFDFMQNVTGTNFSSSTKSTQPVVLSTVNQHYSLDVDHMPSDIAYFNQCFLLNNDGNRSNSDDSSNSHQHAENEDKDSSPSEISADTLMGNTLTSNSFPTAYILPSNITTTLKSAEGATYGNALFPNFQITSAFRPLLLGQLVVDRIEEARKKNASSHHDCNEVDVKENGKQEEMVLSEEGLSGETQEYKPTNKDIKETAAASSKAKNKSSTVKMVMKDGVLIEKQKQRRYRTEKPFSCSYCSGRFTLRSNMDRHVKQQHPAFWRQRQRGSGRIPRNSNKSSTPANIAPSTASSDPKQLTQVLSATYQPSSYSNCSTSGNAGETKEGSAGPNVHIEEHPEHVDEIHVAVCARDAAKYPGKTTPPGTEISADNNKNAAMVSEVSAQEQRVGRMEKNAFGNEKAIIGKKGSSVIKEENTDLASVRSLLDNVSARNFSHFFHTADGNTGKHEDGSEEDEEGLVAGSSSEGNASGAEESRSNSESGGGNCNEKESKKKKSAYSTAPNRVHCDFCYRSFPWASSLRRHTLTHTGQKPYKCSNCPLLFTTKSNCDRHFLRKHKSQLASNENTAVSSDVTSSAVLSQSGSSLLVPAFSSRNVPERPFKCSICPSSTFSTFNNLKKHNAERHGGIDTKNATLSSDTGSDETAVIVDKPSNKGALKDDVAGKRFSPNQTSMHGGTEILPTYAAKCSPTSELGSSGFSPSDLPFKCHLCERNFPERNETLDHIKENHCFEYNHLVRKGALDLNARLEDLSNQEEYFVTNSDENGDQVRGRFPDYSSRKVICAFCLRRFWSAEDLRRHMRTHTGERPFSCDICHRRFTLKHSMLRHRKKHSVTSSTVASDEISPNTDDDEPSSPVGISYYRGKLDDHSDNDNTEYFASEHPSSPSTSNKRFAAERDHFGEESAFPYSVIKRSRIKTNHWKGNEGTEMPEDIGRNESEGARQGSEHGIRREDQKPHQRLKLVSFTNKKRDGNDLIAKLLDIKDESLVDDILTNKSADDAARLLGVRR